MAERRIAGTYLETCNCDPGADGQVAQSERARVDLPELKLDFAGRHAVYSRFGYSNVSGFEDA